MDMVLLIINVAFGAAAPSTHCTVNTQRNGSYLRLGGYHTSW